MSIIDYAVKVIELPRFAPDFVRTDKLKMSRCFEGLHYMYQRRVGHCFTFQEIYDRALEKEILDLRQQEVTKGVVARMEKVGVRSQAGGIH